MVSKRDAKTIPSYPICTLVYSPILALHFAPSSSFMSDDEFAISVVFVPTPSHILFLPAPDPPDSTTGVGKSKFSPNASATIDA